MTNLDSQSTLLNVVHFNDVYRVTPQKFTAASPETFDVTQFAWLVDDLRGKWEKRDEGGLVLFSGDVFSPSVESSVTRGSHMVPVLNELKVDASVTGNHDFDFGYPHLTTLVKDTTFPWLLSNIVDTTTGRIPEALKEFVVLQRSGIRIGLIGLVEKEWIATVASWPAEFEYRSMVDTSIELSKRLRDPDGEYKCDVIIALTHCRLPNDIKLAKEVFAFTPSHQQENPIAGQHGVDLLLGGHDHLYFVPKGVDSWEDFDVTQPSLGAEEDNGDVLIVKSGSDFRDCSDIQLTLEDTPSGSVRNKVIKKVTGKRHVVQPSYPKSEPMAELLKKLLSSVGSTLKAKVCKTTVMLDLRGHHIRTTESVAANWFADIIRPAYDDTLYMNGCQGADGTFICAGTLRGDSTYGPGPITLGDILEILPFEDPVLVIEMDGEAIWDALEASLGTWPSQEGRFPVISGFKVSWDSRREPGNRVIGVWLVVEQQGTPGAEGHGQVTLEPIERTKEGRKFRVVTREYMADGHDGYIALKDCKRIVDEESGMLMSAIVRKYLLGSHFVNKVLRTKAAPGNAAIHPKVQSALSDEEPATKARIQWKNAVDKVIKRIPTSHYRNQLKVSSAQHMSGIDVCDGAKFRHGETFEYVEKEASQDLLVISPEIDGRLKDEGRVE